MEKETGTENDEMVVLVKKNAITSKFVLLLTLFTLFVSNTLDFIYVLCEHDISGGAFMMRMIIYLLMLLILKFLPEFSKPKQWKVAKKHLVEVKE